MNPNENNPTSPAGTGGASSGTGPVDFTNPTSLSSSSSLSMTDSLASAQESLTSAGQAAVAQSSTIGLNQIGADAPSATMDMPNQPLTPAAPVPGSIGSVTSVPMPPATDPLVAASANSAPTTPPVTNVTASNMPAMGAAASTSPASTTPSTASTTASSGQPYYNPFAPRPAMKGNGPELTSDSSSTSIPPALQPPTEKFSDRLNAVKDKPKGGSNIVSIIAWILVLLLAAASVFLFIKWQDAEKRANEQKIVYIEKQPDVTAASLTCSMTLDGQEEGVENLVDRSRRMNATFDNGALRELDLITNYNFTDADAAEAARGYFDEASQYYANIAENMGIDGIATSYDVNENSGVYWLNAKPSQLTGDYITSFNLSVDDNGEANITTEGIQQAYESAGYTCSVGE